jgi:NAD(P)H-hydrate epimerase
MTVLAFRSDAGAVVPAITTDQMREVDRVAIEELSPNLYQMMENAGRNLAVTVIEKLSTGWASLPIVVIWRALEATAVAGYVQPGISPTVS